MVAQNDVEVGIKDQKVVVKVEEVHSNLMCTEQVSFALPYDNGRIVVSKTIVYHTIIYVNMVSEISTDVKTVNPTPSS